MTAEEDAVDEMGVSGRWEFASSLNLSKRRLWTLRVPFELGRLISPAAERSSTSADASTDMMKMLVFWKAWIWKCKEFGRENFEKSRGGGKKVQVEEIRGRRRQLPFIKARLVLLR